MNIGLFNTNGQLLKTNTNTVFDAGNHQIDLNLDNLLSGIYWIRFETDSGIQTIKLIKN